MKGFLSVREAAEKWNVSMRWVNQYIQEGRVPGVERFGKSWVIPEDTKKPERLKPGPKEKRLIQDLRLKLKTSYLFFCSIVRFG